MTIATHVPNFELFSDNGILRICIASLRAISKRFLFKEGFMSLFRKITAALIAVVFCLSLAVVAASAQGRHGWRHDNGRHRGWYKHRTSRVYYGYSVYPRVRYYTYPRTTYYTYSSGYNYPYYTYSPYPTYYNTYRYRTYYRPYRSSRVSLNFRFGSRHHRRW